MKEELEEQILNLEDKVTSLADSINLDEKLKNIKDLEEQMAEPNFWDDKEKANAVIEELNDLKSSSSLVDLKERLKESGLWLELEEKDAISLVKEEIKKITKELSNYEKENILSGEFDKNNCFLEIHSGAGGTEACDWAEILFRMYSRFCDSKNYKYDIINYLAGEEAGIKSVGLHIKGKYSYANLKNEKGIHRLIRLSPFDSNNRRHTSFASVDVVPEIDMNINLEINEKDLKIDVFRSSGKGGQGVNTTDSAVRITHLPTKIVVTCQNERSQIQNKEQAMKMLKMKLYLIEEEKKQKELQDLKGEQKDIDFGSQIRSYILHPYSMVKDHRSNYETSNVDKVLDGYLDEFIEAMLKTNNL